MPQDISAHDIAERLIAGFNGGGPSSLADVCDSSLTINSALIGEDRRANALSASPLTTLIEACRARFPNIAFHSEDVRSTENGLAFTLKGAQAGAAALTIRCMCRIRLVQKKIRELWFEVDEYGLLAQQGRICAAPGESTGASRAKNRLAADALSRAISRRDATADFLDPDAIAHANIETYKDIVKGIETETLRLEGAGKLSEILTLIRNRFHDPIALTLEDGISQGFTTTFKGKISARVGAEMQRYNIVCGFMTPGDRVIECWINITPPPTLMECLL